MAVLKIVPNLAASDTGTAAAFYRDILGLEILMDMDRIVTFGSSGSARPQLSVATEGGAGTPVPDVSMEVDNIDEVYGRVKSSEFDVVYELTEEVWGVRRFYVKDPFGKTINILEHI